VEPCHGGGQAFGIAATGPSDIRRIEAGILNFGIDMTIENNPYEIGMERLVDAAKPHDFIGKEALTKDPGKRVLAPARRLEIAARARPEHDALAGAIEGRALGT
jgi:aminomethyltransferase